MEAKEGERVAKLEERVTQVEKRMDRSEDDRAMLHEVLARIDKTLYTQKTFLGGILFAIGAVWAILQVAWDTIQRHFR